MAAASKEEIEQLLSPYIGYSPGSDNLDVEHPKLLDQLLIYLDLLVKWNGRMNLTSIRDPSEMVRRHFGESLFAARYLPRQGTLLDLGSGAGFPGLPIQLMWPGLSVTLAESQAKKAVFLREVIRVLALGTEVWGNRAEAMHPKSLFDMVILRAVDDPGLAFLTALELTKGSVWLLGSTESLPSVPDDVETLTQIPIPGGSNSSLFELRRKMFHVEQT